MLKRNAFARYFIIFIATCLFGCTPATLNTKPKAKKSPYLSVIFDPMLSLVKVGNELVRLKGDLREFSAEVININNLSEKLSYKFKFYDKDGFEVNPEKTPWKPVIIAPYESTSIQMVAPSKRVLSAKLFIERQK